MVPVCTSNYGSNKVNASNTIVTICASEKVSASKLDDHCSNHNCNMDPSKLILSEMLSISKSNSGFNKVNVSNAIVTFH